MSSTPPLATEVLEAVTRVLARTVQAPGSTQTPEGSADTPYPPDTALRTLAILLPVLEVVIDHAASEVRSSPVRAAAVLKLAEALNRQAGSAQLLAASRAVDAQVHTITEDPLAAINELLGDPAALATCAVLPVDVATVPGRKPLYREDTDFLADALNLTHFQAGHRVRSAKNLVPHIGFNGRPVPPKFPLLGQVLNEGAADPRTLAALAIKFEGLGPGAGAEMENELAQAARTRNAQGLSKLLKDQAKRLDTAAAGADETCENIFIGARYLGRTAKGYEYKLITTAEGHELLASAADILNSPRSKAGTTPVPAADAAPIPPWAVAPGTAPEQLPLAGFNDAGHSPEADPPVEVRPGETVEEALTRQRARRLHQLILDAVQTATAPRGTGRDLAGAPGEPGTSGEELQMPLAPNVTLNVTIDIDSLRGTLDAAGITDRGEDISATTCRRLACNAGLIPIVLNGDGVPLELGRTRRHFTRAQRRAIAVRDKGCINPGCTMRIGRCEAHHLDPWNLGGRTDVSRGCLLCPMCHQAYHSGKFKILMLKGHPHVILSSFRDPEQLPRRNWIFHPAAPPARAA